MKNQFLLSLCFTCALLYSNAQVQVTQINQTMDTVALSMDVLPIDLNGDGIDDFEFQFLNETSGSGGTHKVHFGSSNAGNEVVCPAYLDVTVFNTGDVISAATSGWLSSAGSFDPWGYYESPRLAYRFFQAFGGATNGNFVDLSNVFIGVRFMIGTDTHYGYIEVSSDVTSFPASFTVHSVAYEQTANTAINIGGVASIDEKPQVKPFNIFPNPANDRVVLDFENTIASVTIMNIAGQTVYNVPAPQKSISIEHLETGVYLIQVVDTNGQTHLSRLVKS